LFYSVFHIKKNKKILVQQFHDKHPRARLKGGVFAISDMRS